MNKKILIKKINLNELNNYIKKYGFIIPHAEIYGGLSSSYDFGPLGTFLKKQIKSLWIDFFIIKNNLIHEIDSNILTHEKVLEASGHLKTFQNQYIAKCEICKKTKEVLKTEIDNIKSLEEFELFCDCYKKCENCNVLIDKKNSFCKKELNGTINCFIQCLECKKTIKQITFNLFNLLFKTEKGNSFDKFNFVYLRPETAQGIFINVLQIVRSLKLKIPFGIAQIGKSFRNEITTGRSIFRTTEFEQMEIEFFCEDIKPKDTMYWFEWYVKEIKKFLKEELKIHEENFRENRKTTGIAHYSKVTSDFEYKFPFGWNEIWGLSHRGTYDLTNHMKHSNSNIKIPNSSGQLIIPNVIEPSVGVERLTLMMLFENLFKESNTLTNKERLVLKFDDKFCYYNIAILPLTEKLIEKANEILNKLNEEQKKWRIILHSKKSIGKRYLYHDAIGTKYCITIDYETEIDGKITIRNRDTTNQKRILIDDLCKYFEKNIKNK